MVHHPNPARCIFCGEPESKVADSTPQFQPDQPTLALHQFRLVSQDRNGVCHPKMMRWQRPSSRDRHVEPQAKCPTNSSTPLSATPQTNGNLLGQFESHRRAAHHDLPPRDVSEHHCNQMAGTKTSPEPPPTDTREGHTIEKGLTLRPRFRPIRRREHSPWDAIVDLGHVRREPSTLAEHANTPGVANWPGPRQHREANPNLRPHHFRYRLPPKHKDDQVERPLARYRRPPKRPEVDLAGIGSALPNRRNQGSPVVPIATVVDMAWPSVIARR